MVQNDLIYQRLRAALNSRIQGLFTTALLQALAEGDRVNAANVIAVKDQLFIATASGQYLDSLFSGIGITRPAGIGISDDSFRALGIAQTSSKLVTNIFLDVLEIFYGPEAVQANVLSGLPEDYVLKDGMTLIILVDNNTVPLTVTFNSENFNNIDQATANEVAAEISRQAFNAGYTLTASSTLDPVDKLNHVELLSGTLGPRSSITVIGGSAQNVLLFPEITDATPSIGTQFSTSFVNEFVRFTWTSGPNPSLEFVNAGDYVNIYGAGYLQSNQGSFIVQDVQDGPVGSAYFDIINPNFTAQGPVTLAGVDSASGSGIVSVSAEIDPVPTGAVRSSGTVTITTLTPHHFAAGQLVTLTNVADSTFNSSFIILATPTTTTFTFSQSGPNSNSGRGTATVTTNIQPVPTGAVRSAGVSTIQTATPHNLSPGEVVTVSGVSDSSFDGLFTIATVPNTTTFTYAQVQSNDVVFIAPVKTTIQSLSRYASVYEVNPYEVVVFLPVTTRIIKRSLIGAWHVHGTNTDTSYLGCYLYDPKSGFSVRSIATNLTTQINAGSFLTVAFGSNTSAFPNSSGFLVFEYGTSNQEGPVPYIGAPSSGSWLIDPSYKFQKTHAIGSEVRLINNRSPFIPNTDGSDYGMYLTGTTGGRIEAENLITSLSATGITLTFILVYPENPGISSTPFVYGGDNFYG